jgi:hypothetical protein
MAIPTWINLCHTNCPKDNFEITSNFLVEAAGYFVVLVLVLVVACAFVSKYLKSRKIKSREGES